MLAPFYMGSFSSTSQADFFFMWGVSLTHPVLDFFDVRSFFAPVLPSILSREFLLHTLCWLRFFMWGVSLTHPKLASFLSRELLLHIPSWVHFYLVCFSDTFCIGFTFIWGVFLTHPMPALIFCGEFLLHIPCWLFFFFFFFIWGVSHTHPVLLSFLSGEFLNRRVGAAYFLNIPWWLHLYLGSFSFTSHADFFMWEFSYTSLAGSVFLFVCVCVCVFVFCFCFLIIWGVSHTFPVLASFLSGEFLLHIPCWLHFYLGSFSDTSRAGFT